MVEMVPGEEALALQEADSGVVRLRAGDPFSEEMSALWLGVQSLGFVLVCEPHENLLLAEGTLRNLTRHCLDHLHMLGPGSEVSTNRKEAPGCVVQSGALSDRSYKCYRSRGHVSIVLKVLLTEILTLQPGLDSSTAENRP